MHSNIIEENGKKSNANLDIRLQNQLLEKEEALLKSANLEGIAPVEAWTAIGTNNQLAYATHGFFRYFGKFPPPIATHLITKYTNPGDLVCDPMCGSGTSGVESILLNRQALLNDVNPLSCLLADVKTRSLEEENMREAIERIENRYVPLTEEEYNFSPIGLRNASHWFLPETTKSLRGIKKLIDEESNEHIRNFLNVAFAGTVRRVSRATTQQGRLFLDVDTAVENALPFFVKRAQKGLKGIVELPKTENLPTITSFNLVEGIPEKYQNMADLLILHPPYFNSYKYSSINSLELAWLGMNYHEVRKNEVKEFFKVGKPENSERYVEDMLQVLNNVSNILKPGKILALMIGDTIMKGQHIRVTREIIDRLDKELFDVELIALRVPKYTEAAWVASQRRKSNDIGITLYDYIVLLRRL